MKTRAAVAWKVNEPLSIEEVELQGPRAGEVRISANVTADFGIVTGLRSVLGCAEKIVGMRSS